MKPHLAFFGFTALMFLSCMTLKMTSSSKADINDAIQNSVIDFVHSKKALNKKIVCCQFILKT